MNAEAHAVNVTATATITAVRGAPSAAWGCSAIAVLNAMRRRAVRSCDDVRQHPLALAVRGEQVAMDAQQPVDVVDVIVEVRNEQERAVFEVRRQTCDVALVAAREHVIVVEVLGDTAPPGRRPGPA